MKTKTYITALKSVALIALALNIVFGYTTYSQSGVIEDLTQTNQDQQTHIKAMNARVILVNRVARDIKARARIETHYAQSLARIYISAGEKYGVDPKILVRIGAAESNYNPRAVSHMGARGVQQIMWKYWGGNNVPYVKTPRDLFDPERNIFYSAYIFAHFKRLCGGPIKAVTCYNGGPRALKYPKAETIKYRAKVLKGYEPPKDVTRGYQV